MKSRSVKLPFLTKNSTHLREASAHDSSWTSNGIYALVKKGVKLPSVTKNKNISLHLHTRAKQLPLPNIHDLYLNLLIVKNKIIRLPFVTWKKNLFPFVYYWLMSYFTENAKLISFITSHHYTEITQCILCNCHNPLQTGLKITNRHHTGQSLLFNQQSLCA